MCLRDSAWSTWKREHYEMGKLITRMLALTRTEQAQQERGALFQKERIGNRSACT